MSDKITIEGLSKSYGSSLVLDNIHLKIASGERVVICGPSGSGKSTLIRCLAQLEMPDQGNIQIDGELLSADNIALHGQRPKIGMVFQQFNLFPHLSALANVALAPRKVLGLSQKEAMALAEQRLDEVQLSEHRFKYPAQLSGGQQQRVAIARALAMAPQILLLDEPTSALDPEMIQEVLEVMARIALSGNKTMLCVTHEMSFARQVADRIIFMDQGAIIEEGSPATFFSAPKTARAQAFLSKILTH